MMIGISSGQGADIGNRVCEKMQQHSGGIVENALIWTFLPQPHELCLAALIIAIQQKLRLLVAAIILSLGIKW